MSGNKNKMIAFNYFGGKMTWLDNIYENCPAGFTHMVDLFAGSMAVSLNYRGNVIRTANEINGEITNFFAQLRDNEDALIRLLRLTPCSALEYKNCWEPSDDPLERARRFYVRVRQSFFGLGAQRQNKGWHMAKQYVNAQGGETVSRWKNGVEKLHDVATEIRTNFQIVNGHYMDIIDKVDFPGAFFYCDPPYPKECRGSYNDYRFEFTDADHDLLAHRLHNIQGKAMISSYDCALMDELYGDWHKIRFPFKKNNIRSGIKNGSGVIMQECVWCNYEPPKKQQKLFEQ
jgi:DNA adenine methylase